MAKHNETGRTGEYIACKYLETKGFSIIERNYRKPWGEIDIVARNNDGLHFVEVKTVTRVTNGSGSNSIFRPEDAVHHWKQERMRRVIQSYLSDYNKKDVTRVTAPDAEEPSWQFDIVAIELVQEQKTAKVRFLGKVIL